MHHPLSFQMFVVASFPRTIQHILREGSSVVLLLVQHTFPRKIFPDSTIDFLKKKGKEEMSLIRAIVVDPDVPGRLAIKEVEAPQVSPSEALVQVETISWNRGA